MISRDAALRTTASEQYYTSKIYMKRILEVRKPEEGIIKR